MENFINIYDLRKKEELLFILPTEESGFTPAEDILCSAAAAVNLYYTDTVEMYLNYLGALPKAIPIYLISSNPLVIEKAEAFREKRGNTAVIKKENRGRDVSALLVSFREIAKKYKYVCFLHDKKAKHEYMKADTDIWIRNLWENMVGTEDYLYNLLRLFEKNPEFGLLVPPEPMGEYIYTWYGDAWEGSYEPCEQLVKKLRLNCSLDYKKPPITIGTVFWARTKCLKKLLEFEWKYEDFPEEPLPADGTISHGIERIFGYVAQDAGYKTATVMTESYAKWCMLFIQDHMRTMFRLVEQKLGVHSIHQMEHIKRQRGLIENFFLQYEKVYLYGAGVYGRELLDSMRIWGLEPTGFLVSNGRKEREKVKGLNVYELCEISPDEDLGIIVAVNYNLQKEIETFLKEQGFHHYILGYPL